MNHQQAYEEFLELAARGCEQPRAIVEALEADAELAPELRSQLTWDDRAAAHEWRVHEMRTVLKTIKLSIRYVVPDSLAPERMTIRAVHAVPQSMGARTHVWKSTIAILGDRADQNAISAEIERAVRSAVRRFERWRGLVSVVLRRIADELDEQ